MSAPDFYFVVNSMARHMYDRYGKKALIDYWRSLGREYYRQRRENWRSGGVEAVASDWRDYFDREPQSRVNVEVVGNCVALDVQVCPAIKHLRSCGRDIVPCFCEQCDYVCGAMAEEAGFSFERAGGMGSCQQQFAQLPPEGSEH